MVESIAAKDTGLFQALQQVAEHCETDEVACAAVSLAASALCDHCETLEEAEVHALVLGKMMLENLRHNWPKVRGNRT